MHNYIMNESATSSPRSAAHVAQKIGEPHCMQHKHTTFFREKLYSRQTVGRSH